MFKQISFIALFCMLLSGCSMNIKTKKAVKFAADDVIVLAMHGVPANDTPPDKVGEYHKLHGMMETAPPHVVEGIKYHYEELNDLVRNWPRTPENDPYYFGTKKIADAISEQTGAKVVMAFNEFCAPDLPTAFANVVNEGATNVIVITAMLTPGGNHAEIDIPEAVEVAEKTHPGVSFTYTWPFQINAIADVLVDQIGTFVAE
jgi:sirohydrochlorin cobaltochelatase